jgi:hypothetical protein
VTRDGELAERAIRRAARHFKLNLEISGERERLLGILALDRFPKRAAKKRGAPKKWTAQKIRVLIRCLELLDMSSEDVSVRGLAMLLKEQFPNHFHSAASLEKQFRKMAADLGVKL